MKRIKIGSQGIQEVVLTETEIAERQAQEAVWAAEQAAAHLTSLTAALYAERDRRLAAGFDFDFGDTRGAHRIGTTERDLKGWEEVETLVTAIYRAGLTGKTIEIATDSGLATITPEEWTQITLAAAAFRQPIWQASFAIAARIDAGEILTADQIAAAPEWPA